MDEVEVLVLVTAECYHFVRLQHRVSEINDDHRAETADFVNALHEPATTRSSGELV